MPCLYYPGLAEDTHNTRNHSTVCTDTNTAEEKNTARFLKVSHMSLSSKHRMVPIADNCEPSTNTIWKARSEMHKTKMTRNVIYCKMCLNQARIWSGANGSKRTETMPRLLDRVDTLTKPIRS